MGTDSAVTREAAWLNTSNDGVAVLPAQYGGPWQIVQAYWPGSRLQAKKTGIYVQRATIADVRGANQRIRPGYAFRLKLVWPVTGLGGNVPLAENAQQALDTAVELLVERIRGPLGDKSHGGRFLSAGETPGREPQVTVTFEDPELTIPMQAALRATAVYQVDDYDINA